MKRRGIMGGVFLIVAALAITASGEDFTSKSTEELSRIRSSIHNAPSEEQDAFYREWNSRLRGMSDDQRRYFIGSEGFDDRRGSGSDSRGGETEVRGSQDEFRGGEMELRGRAQEGEGALRGTGDGRRGSGGGGEGSGGSGSSGSGSGSSGKGGGKKGGK